MEVIVSVVDEGVERMAGVDWVCVVSVSDRAATKGYA